MRDLGVSDKQLGKARQVFSRSAEQAGFFRQGKDRLVAPPTAQASAASQSSEDKPRREVSSDLGDYDPLIVGLFRRLPITGEWSAGEQKKWLDLAGHIIPIVYGSDGEADDT